MFRRPGIDRFALGHYILASLCDFSDSQFINKTWNFAFLEIFFCQIKVVFIAQMSMYEHKIRVSFIHKILFLNSTGETRLKSITVSPRNTNLQYAHFQRSERVYQSLYGSCCTYFTTVLFKILYFKI